MTKISTIITGHREGVLVGPSIRSLLDASTYARQHGYDIETIFILDRPDELTKKQVESAAIKYNFQLFICDHGDPGQSRNTGVDNTSGDYITFLDADDLWSYNWIVNAHRVCEKRPDTTIAQSMMNVIFGDRKNVWFHVDSVNENFKFEYLRVANYWDSLTLAHRSIYKRFPFKKNNLALGYGHEDWHWNCVTLSAGIAHRPAPDTVHFKRARRGSQLEVCGNYDVVPWPTDLNSFSFAPPETAVGSF